jgi:hypothetical protein
MYKNLLVYSVGQSTQFSYAVVDALSTADRKDLDIAKIQISIWAIAQLE